ncbi:CGNR zinc finger domain-containing protein [Arthrobacter sp. NPDC090010]|uniref:CGNR zinc finger domain-containing protein n=1 Tax=Arthrobacter sp. NPDC090010 TaxID=3363942 RepID=UPI003804969A
MHLNPYGEYAVLLAQSLANDWPADRDGIVARTRDFGMTMVFAEEAREHERLSDVVEEWLAVVDASEPRARARLLNRIMADEAAYPHLTDHDEEGWHLHYRDDGKGLVNTLRAVFAVGTALHLTTRGMHRLSRCAAGAETPGDCRNVVVDVSRNGTQKYCSVRCANRAAVRRHRAAQHQDS